jgi:hypothetical protein
MLEIKRRIKMKLIVIGLHHELREKHFTLQHNPSFNAAWEFSETFHKNSVP